MNADRILIVSALYLGRFIWDASSGTHYLGRF
jgi:hypothetical protein